jgi:hypothetical protein
MTPRRRGASTAKARHDERAEPGPVCYSEATVSSLDAKVSASEFMQ